VDVRIYIIRKTERLIQGKRDTAALSIMLKLTRSNGKRLGFDALFGLRVKTLLLSSVLGLLLSEIKLKVRMEEERVVAGYVRCY